MRDESRRGTDIGLFPAFFCVRAISMNVVTQAALEKMRLSPHRAVPPMALCGGITEGAASGQWITLSPAVNRFS